ncbi:hypothetical protein C3B47_14325 [Flavobacterium columnare]|uniref:hypothetical protein n=1 Tax=Flavobacterium columnare TaxID=996 RepID=UPI0018968D49|nr:hypothetical protein [Flavobacterium columnare]MBF6654030.1 hypothetical protein [Flavobacterium columnare]
MNNLLENIIFIVKNIQKSSVESGYTLGKILISEDIFKKINEIDNNNNNNIIEIEINNQSIDLEELKSEVNSTGHIKIKTGDISNYFETIEDFISGNKFECKHQDYYIREVDYRDSLNENELIEKYKKNLILIDFLKELSNQIKKSGNKLELFFYKSGIGVDVKIDYEIQNLKNFEFTITDDFKSQILDAFNGKDKKELFVNELINLLEKNNNSYSKLVENWNTLISNYQKSYSLFIAGFSFEKIKTSSNEHFQKLVDRIYESIGKASNYIFGR